MSQTSYRAKIDDFTHKMNVLYGTPTSAHGESGANIGHFYVKKEGKQFSLCGIENKNGGIKVLKSTDDAKGMSLYLNGLIEGFVCGQIATESKRIITEIQTSGHDNN